GMVVLDPAAAQPTLDVFTTNYQQLDVKLYRFAPSDYDAFGVYMQNMWNHDHPPSMPGVRVFANMVKTSPARDTLVETHVDLAPAPKGGLGDVGAVVSPWPGKKDDGEPPRLIAWVQSTKLAVDAFVDNDHLVAFASDLATGKALSGVRVEVKP